MQSTQHYIDNERNFISNIGQKQSTEVIEFKTSILPMVEQVEIDVDIEKEIAQLQEAKMSEGIKKVVPVDFDTELGSFFSTIKVEKEELEEYWGNIQNSILSNVASSIWGKEYMFKKLLKITILLTITISTLFSSTELFMKKKIYLIAPRGFCAGVTRAVDTVTPVSYTHLTLPTKRIV